jgi:hypothetical protein
MFTLEMEVEALLVWRLSMCRDLQSNINTPSCIAIVNYKMGRVGMPLTGLIPPQF